MTKDIAKAFLTEGRSVYDLLQQPGVGFYIPLYQREYSWEAGNVQQLIDDLSKGVDSLCTKEEEDEIRFLGTLITVSEPDRNKIHPLDTTALPAAIELVIDGQQRLTTIVLFASQLYLLILDEETKIKKFGGDSFASVEEACNAWRNKLKQIFALDLGRGNPKLKPKIIRGQKDYWTKDGDIKTAYTSPAAKYISEFIQFITDIEVKNTPFKLNDAPSFGKESVTKKHMVANSVKQFRSWLTDTVVRAHLKEEDDFPSAKVILAPKNQEFIWDYDRPELKKFIDEEDGLDPKSGTYHLCALVQLFAVAHYLLDRCCFTVIRPKNDKWAFDMFQSLNATGTPLTVIETFKPSVMNTVEMIEKKEFKESEDAIWFAKVEALFDGKSASEKNRLTSDFLTSFALVADAENPKLASHFSAQRKWLEKFYSDSVPALGNDEKAKSSKKHEFVKFIGQYADFYKNTRSDTALVSGTALPLLNGQPEGDLATVILLYLNKSNHRMAITILAQYYITAQNGQPEEQITLAAEFIEAVKAIGAFYTLWRSAQSNSGLDSKYRTFFKGSKPKEGSSKAFENTIAWLQRTQQPTIAHLKQYLRDNLTLNTGNDTNKVTYTKETWLKKAKNNLVYDSKQTAKFVLLLYAHDTIPDPAHPGLAKVGVKGVNHSLSVSLWNSPNLSTIEHVAPSNSKLGSAWDTAIYADELYNSIGNLILLPGRINSSMGNKDWNEKLIYFKHLGEPDPDVLAQLAAGAVAKGEKITEHTIGIMQEAAHQAHIKSILSMEEIKDWDAAFIEQRTERILSITWDRLMKWLE